jgi:hypothetical protein
MAITGAYDMLSNIHPSILFMAAFTIMVLLAVLMG